MDQARSANRSTRHKVRHKAELLTVKPAQKGSYTYFREPFALQKVRATSFINMMHGKVYCGKAVESTNST